MSLHTSVHGERARLGRWEEALRSRLSQVMVGISVEGGRRTATAAMAGAAAALTAVTDGVRCSEGVSGGVEFSHQAYGSMLRSALGSLGALDSVGSPGSVGLVGSPGSPGTRGSLDAAGSPGSRGSRGSRGARGPHGVVHSREFGLHWDKEQMGATVREVGEATGVDVHANAITDGDSREQLGEQQPEPPPFVRGIVTTAWNYPTKAQRTTDVSGDGSGGLGDVHGLGAMDGSVGADGYTNSSGRSGRSGRSGGPTERKEGVEGGGGGDGDGEDSGSFTVTDDSSSDEEEEEEGEEGEESGSTSLVSSSASVAANVKRSVPEVASGLAFSPPRSSTSSFPPPHPPARSASAFSPRGEGHWERGKGEAKVEEAKSPDKLSRLIYSIWGPEETREGGGGAAGGGGGAMRGAHVIGIGHMGGRGHDSRQGRTGGVSSRPGAVSSVEGVVPDLYSASVSAAASAATAAATSTKKVHQAYDALMTVADSIVIQGARGG